MGYQPSDTIVEVLAMRGAVGHRPTQLRDGVYDLCDEHRFGVSGMKVTLAEGESLTVECITFVAINQFISIAQPTSMILTVYQVLAPGIDLMRLMVTCRYRRWQTNAHLADKQQTFDAFRCISYQLLST